MRPPQMGERVAINLCPSDRALVDKHYPSKPDGLNSGLGFVPVRYIEAARFFEQYGQYPDWLVIEEVLDS